MRDRRGGGPSGAHQKYPLLLSSKGTGIRILELFSPLMKGWKMEEGNFIGPQAECAADTHHMHPSLGSCEELGVAAPPSSALGAARWLTQDFAAFVLQGDLVFQLMVPVLKGDGLKINLVEYKQYSAALVQAQ